MNIKACQIVQDILDFYCDNWPIPDLLDLFVYSLSFVLNFKLNSFYSVIIRDKLLVFAVKKKVNNLLTGPMEMI